MIPADKEGRGDVRFAPMGEYDDGTRLQPAETVTPTAGVRPILRETAKLRPRVVPAKYQPKQPPETQRAAGGGIVVNVPSRPETAKRADVAAPAPAIPRSVLTATPAAAPALPTDAAYAGVIALTLVGIVALWLLLDRGE